MSGHDGEGRDGHGYGEFGSGVPGWETGYDVASVDPASPIVAPLIPAQRRLVTSPPVPGPRSRNGPDVEWQATSAPNGTRIEASAVPYGTPPVAVDQTVADEAAKVRAAIVEQLAERVSAAESRAGAVMGLEQRRATADELISDVLERRAQQRLSQRHALLSPDVEARVRRAVLDALFGLGGLQPLLDDPDIENININGCDEVFVRYADGRRARVGAVAASDDELVELIRQLAARGGVQERRFDPGAPMLNLQLPDGSRLFAVMAVCERPGVSIRRHRHRRVTLAQLVELGTIDVVLHAFLGAAVRAKFNILIAGGTGIGKTTFLIALASEFGRFERLLTIEDAFELGFDKDPQRHADVKAMQVREANTEGEGAVTQTDLVRAALRKSPDRVIVGEIRGPEVVSVCNVMSQGTDGSMATIHASSTRGVFTKMAAYAAQGPERLTVEATALLVASAVHLVVHLDWSSDGRRVVSGIREVVDADGPHVISNEVFAPGLDRRARPAAPLRAETMARLVAAGLDADLLTRGYGTAATQHWRQP